MSESLRIAGISDTHFGRLEPHKGDLHYRSFRKHVKEMSGNADVIVHCGDFTDRGDEKSLTSTANILSEATKPVIGVLGNHDIRYDPQMAAEILTLKGGITLLEGNTVAIQHHGESVGFIGMPGFLLRENKRPRYLSMTKEEYEAMCSAQATTFRKELRNLEGRNNVALFHFDQMQSVPNPENPEEEELHLSDSIRLVDDHTDQVNLVLHGHDHRNINRPATTPNHVDIIDLAVPIHIKMHPGIPYRIIDLPLR